MRAASLLLALVATACGAEAPGSPVTAEPPPLPERPAVPAGWRTITSDEGDLSVAVPPDLIVIHTAGSINGFRNEGDGVETSLTVAAIPPGELLQPRGGQSVEAWADEGGWLTGGQGHIGDGEVRRRDVLLPAGPAIELTSTYEVGDLGQVWTQLYVVETPSGHGLLQVSGDGPPADEPPDEVRLMRELVEFRP